MARWTVVLSLVLAAGVILVAVAALQLEERSVEAPPASLLYLPRGPYLRATALGQESLLADLLYLWAIQYYSSYDVAERHEYLEAVFTEAITELDPHYEDAYWIGALIMSIEANEPDAAFRLLDKGIRLNPQSWRLPYVAGWEAYLHRRYDLARTYFDRARAHPDAPAHLERTHAAVLEKSGRPQEALRSWWEVSLSSEDPYVLAVAERWIRQLTAQLLQEAVERHEKATGRAPATLDALAGDPLLPRSLLSEDWRDYVYDRDGRRVRPPDLHVMDGAR
jgi:tetratricopeptide (TPR) repeat protein